MNQTQETTERGNADEIRWKAVVERDPAADGRFYYAVVTTGVFCRPSCRSRLAKRENVRFFATVEEAERAGFRACKRCRPADGEWQEKHAAAVAQACRMMETSDEPPGLQELAAAAGMSGFHFHRLFKQITGVTPKAYAAGHRAQRMRAELAKQPTVTDAIYEAGFQSNGRFYAQSSEMLGMKPAAYRKGGAGERIRFAVGQCSLGAILVASSARGTCAISLGDDAEKLIRDLEERFPHAELVAGDRSFERLVSQVVGWVEAPQLGLALPLDVRGTAFQQRVWQALREIPAGSTASYTDIARTMGCPRAVRAVAQACAANPLAVAIPCHRVVRRDGNLSGYRWGIERKRSLLRREAEQAGGDALRPEP